MSYRIHPQARTTPKVRQELKDSPLSATQLAALHNVTVPTVMKWKRRDSVEDLPHTAHNLQTTLTPLQEAIVVELRRTLLLPLDDLLAVAKEFVNPEVSRSGLNRCLARHGVGNLRTLVAEQNPEAADKKPGKSFKDYEPGFLHVDIKHLPKMPDEAQRRYLFVAIDHATRWVFFRIYAGQTEASSCAFLRELAEACPVKIQKLLTDNGTQFTDRFTSTGKQPTGKHAFDQACAEQGIEHRLIPPRRPQTNGMVERFNGRVGEVISQTRFATAAELEKTLYAYLEVYNHHIPQKALGHQPPVQALKEWRAQKPEIFIKDIYDRPELDM